MECILSVSLTSFSHADMVTRVSFCILFENKSANYRQFLGNLSSGFLFLLQESLPKKI